MEYNNPVTVEGIDDWKLTLPTVRLRVTRPHKSRIYTTGVVNNIPGGYDLLGQDPPSQSLSGPPMGPALCKSPPGADVHSSPAVETQPVPTPGQ